MEFWTEFPPTFMLVRGVVGYKPDKSAQASRRRTVEASDPIEREMFVRQWGGAKKHPDSLPAHIQEAFQAAFLRDFKETNNGE